MPASDMEAVYSTGHILPAILNGLVAAGKDPEHIGPDDLVMVEEFHTLGPMATAALAGGSGRNRAQRRHRPAVPARQLRRCLDAARRHEHRRQSRAVPRAP